MLEVFRNGGSAKLDVPQPSSAFVLPEEFAIAGSSSKGLNYRQRLETTRRKAEMYSLWCTSLYMLSLANHVRIVYIFVFLYN